jgi:DNA-binding MarR family transcriptional regulator
MRRAKIARNESHAIVSRDGRPIAQQLAAAASLIRRSAAKAYPELTGLSTMEGEVLRSIGSAGQTAARNIAETSTLNEGLVSVTVRGLIGKGLVRRVQDPADARRRLLTLTPKGTAKLSKINDLLKRRQHQILRGMTKKEQARFFQLLDRVMDNARQMVSRRNEGD